MSSPVQQEALEQPLLDEPNDLLPPPASPLSNDGWAKYKTSFYLLCLIGLLDSIEYGFIMPALYKFMKELDPEDDDVRINHLYGVVLSVFSAASLTCKPLLGWYCDRRPYKETIVISTLIAVAGNLVYFFARPLKHIFGKGWSVLALARVLSGVGCANTSLTFAYVARTSSVEDRTRQMTLMGMIKVIGFQLGPATNAITGLIDFSIAGFKIDSLNSPGLFIAIFQILVVFLILMKLLEPPPYHAETKEKVLGNIYGFFSFCNLNIMLNFSNILAFNFQIACMEALATPITHDAFNWSPMQNSWIFMVLTFVSIIGTIVVMKLSKTGVEDRLFLVVSGVMSILEVIVLYELWFYDMTVLEFYIGVVVAALPTPFAFSPNRSNFSKNVEGNRNQALLQSSLSIFASLGGILGPIFIGSTLSTRDRGVKHQHIAPKSLIGLEVVSVFIFCSNLYVLYVRNGSSKISNSRE